MAEANAPLVLVTGASGYVASHCIKQLLESGEYRVRGSVRSLKNEAVCQAIQNFVEGPKYPLELVEGNLQEVECWKKAVEGCTYVLHVASPFPASVKNEDEVIRPAVDGTLNVLKACEEVGGIKRVVVTSSTAAIAVGNFGKGVDIDETMWSDMAKATPYEKSKILAEKAAWDFVEKLPEEKKFELAVVNPGFIIGPNLMNKPGVSLAIIKQLLLRETPVVPEVCITMIDVRDVAKAHIKCMTVPDAAGHRHLLSEGGHTYTFLFLADCLAKEFNSQGYNVPTRKAPKFLLWLGSLFKQDIRAAYPYVGIPWNANNGRMKNVLGLEPISIAESVVEMAYSMIELGMVTKAPGYKGRKSKEDVPKEDTAKEENAKADDVKDENADVVEASSIQVEIPKDSDVKEDSAASEEVPKDSSEGEEANTADQGTGQEPPKEDVESTKDKTPKEGEETGKSESKEE